MISKDRVFVISSNVDDSIKSVSLYSEVHLFKTFTAFENYVDVNPIDAETIIINSKDLPFTNSSMNRIVAILNSTFVALNGNMYYLVDDEQIKEKVDELCKRNGYDKLKCLYLRTLYARDVASVLTGEALSSKETAVELRTFRIRAADYVRTKGEQESLDYSDKYITDEDELSGITDEPVPEDLRFSSKPKAVRCNICCNNLRERSVWVLLKAQYLAMNGKTLVLERDTDYHTLFDMLTKSDIDYEFFDVVDIIRDVSDVIQQIRSCRSKLIFIGTKARLKYNYDVLLDILMSNLDDNVDYYIYESTLNNIPYGVRVDIVTPTTVPELLRSLNEMSGISRFEDVTFIGLDITNLGSVSITESEYKAVLETILQENNIKSVVVRTRGIILRREVGLGGVFMHS